MLYFYIHMKFEGDFNINKKTWPRLVAVLLFIIGLSMIKIGYGYMIAGSLLSIAVLGFEHRLLSKAASTDPSIVYKKRQKIFTIVGFGIIIALFVFIGFMAFINR